jgi:2'-5' RNA ligase
MGRPYLDAPGHLLTSIGEIVMETLRAFIAIELTPEILSRLNELQTRLQNDLPSGLIRWVRPEGIHLTLKFLGDIPVTQVDAIAQILQTVCAPYTPFSFSISGMGCFPNPRRPRVIWVGVHEPSGALAEIQQEIERAAKPLGYPPENRAFSPHLTLGRVKRGSREALEALGTYVTRSAVNVGQQQVGGISLMCSDLRPTGAVYTELALALLSGPKSL